ncbi:MAG: hypothetical protein ACXQS8_09725 [Candidatus Helarchaeales archaeon]
MVEDDETFWMKMKRKVKTFVDDLETRNEGQTIREIYFTILGVSLAGMILSLIFMQPILVILFIIIFFLMIYKLL